MLHACIVDFVLLRFYMFNSALNLCSKISVIQPHCELAVIQHQNHPVIKIKLFTFKQMIGQVTQ